MAGCVALVAAAGRGIRLGGACPKQYRPLAGQPLLRHSLRTLAHHPRIDAVRAIIGDGDRALYDAAARGLALLPPVVGGASRQDSVRIGLESLEGLAPDRVLIHDGARPFASAALVDRVLAALEDAPAVVPAVPLADTVKRVAGERVTGTMDRAGLWRAQTPQGFRYPFILEAHRAARGLTLTDDAAVAEQAGAPVHVVPGNEDNMKVTTEEDLRRAERLAGGPSAETRVGTGFDVHRFGPGDHVMLCGVAVPHGAGLVGHSDADVGLHALTDALLGALGAGDIGTYFPPGDPQWKDVPSRHFLAHAAGLVAGRGGRIVHVDVTLICERPRIGPHRPAMTERIAAILGIGAERVSVKATTTERLGFTGRQEGIAAQAAATILLPA